MTEIKTAGYLQGYLPKTAAKKLTLKDLLGMGGDPPEGMTQEGLPVLPAVRPMFPEDNERAAGSVSASSPLTTVMFPEDKERAAAQERENVIYMPDGRTEWEGDDWEETPYATADSLYNDETGLSFHGLPEGYEYLASDVNGDPLLRDPEGNLVTMFHESGDLRKVKTQLKIVPRKKKQVTGKTAAEEIPAEVAHARRNAEAFMQDKTRLKYVFFGPKVTKKVWGVDMLGQRMDPDYFMPDYEQKGIMVRTEGPDPLNRYHPSVHDAPIGMVYY